MSMINDWTPNDREIYLIMLSQHIEEEQQKQNKNNNNFI